LQVIQAYFIIFELVNSERLALSKKKSRKKNLSFAPSTMYLSSSKKQKMHLDEKPPKKVLKVDSRAHKTVPSNSEDDSVNTYETPPKMKPRNPDAPRFSSG
jgi:hypothetical protein